MASSDSALASAKKTLNAAKALSARVAKEGVTSGGGGSRKGAVPVATGPKLNPQNEVDIANRRWGIQPGENVTYTELGPKNTYGKSFKASDFKAGAYTPSDFGEPAIAPGLPQKEEPDPGDVITPGNEQLNTGMEGFNVTLQDGKWVPSEVTGTDAATANFMNRQNSIMDVWNNRETAADIWGDVLKQTKRDEYAKDVAKYTGEINAIVAKRDADVLSLEGQGRGIPEVIIGGQQAQINREAAIKALPIQAMLATAQGNLEMANQQLTQLYQIRMADATAQTNFQMGVVNALFDFADKKEQRQFETIQADIARKDAEVKMNIQRQDDWARMAVETGQPGLVGQINKLDPNSSTFRQDFAKLTGQIVKPSVGVSDSADWELKEVGGVIYQHNKRTNELIKVGDAVGEGGALDPAVTMGSIAQTRDVANDALKYVSAAGRSGIRRGAESLFWGATDFTELQSRVDTIKVNLLTLNTDPAVKKFFGPQMSNRDTELMTSAATPLDVSKMTPESVNAYINDAIDMLDRMEKVMQNQNATWGLVITAPDGSNDKIILTN